MRFDQNAALPPILHLTFFNPLDDHYGQSPLEAVAIAVDTHNAAACWNKALLDKAARPSGALVYAGADGGVLSPVQYERLKKEFTDFYQGANNAGRPLVLDGAYGTTTIHAQQPPEQAPPQQQPPPQELPPQQQPPQQQQPALTQQQIQQLVAPIALYPDPLLAQVLTASTYPLEVTLAARWVEKNPNLKGSALEGAMQQQPWDPSVKGLTSVPQVLAMMNEKLDWTNQLAKPFSPNPMTCSSQFRLCASRPKSPEI